MIPGNVRIYLCSQPGDMRRSFDGLAQAARDHMGKEPERGGLFVFLGKNRRRLKVLWLDGRGYCLFYKRLHGARFVVPMQGGGPCVDLDTHMLAELLKGVEAGRGGRRLH